MKLIVACTLLMFLPGCAVASLPIWAKPPVLATVQHGPEVAPAR